MADAATYDNAISFFDHVLDHMTSNSRVRRAMAFDVRAKLLVRLLNVCRRQRIAPPMKVHSLREYAGGYGKGRHYDALPPLEQM